MTALGNNIPAQQVSQILAGVQVPIKNTYKVYQGAMVAPVTAAPSYFCPANATTCNAVAGVAQAEAATATSDGSVNVNLLNGTFKFALDSSNPPTIAHMFGPVYAKDDNTISYSSSDGPLAGVLVGFEATSGWALVYINAANNAALQGDFKESTITGALSTVADAPAKAVLTSIIAALVANGATNSTT